MTLPAAAVVGALIGLIFGLPSLRLRGLYLAVSTLALHFVVIYLGNEYEARRGYSTGVVIEPPSLGGVALTSPRAWYFVLFVFALAALLLGLNLLRAKTGRAWRAIQGREAVAEALGINVPALQGARLHHQLHDDGGGGVRCSRTTAASSRPRPSRCSSPSSTSPWSSSAAWARCWGPCSAPCSSRCSPTLIEWLMAVLPTPAAWATSVFAVNYAAFGLVMILFLLFEPQGLVGIWRRVQDYFLLWPFQQRTRAR